METEFFKSALGQGFNVAMLVIAVWYLHSSNSKLVDQLTKAHESRVDDLTKRIDYHREEIKECREDREALWKEIIELKKHLCTNPT